MIWFVGAGPGAPDLITLRGARLLAEADLVLYAGSLVNPELLEMCPESCVRRDSAGMTLDEQVALLCGYDGQGKRCVRLHTGDPSLFGAVREQMDELERRGVAFEVVPGVSSLFGAAAALRTQLTAPEVSQTLIVTRAAGRTPVPERERLRELAAHGATMALFLSAGLLDEVQDELAAAGVDPQTPAAIAYRVSWPDEALYRCTAGTLAACAREHGVRKTALVVIGEVLDARDARSKLYDPGFSHGYRDARDETSGSIPHGGLPCRGAGA